MTVWDALSYVRSQGLEAELLNGSLSYNFTRFCDLKFVSKRSLCFWAGHPDLLQYVVKLKDCVVIIPYVLSSVDSSVVQIVCKKPKLMFMMIAEKIMGSSSGGIHSTACVEEGAFVHPTATIGPNVFVGKNSSIGAGTIVEANTVIGATGQSFKWFKEKKFIMPQIGGVIIGQDCFIGSNITVVKGAFSNTIIEDGVRIAHGSQIGHNVVVGKHSFLANGVIVAGGADIGQRCFIGSGAIIRNKIKLAQKICVGCGAVVVKDFLDEGVTIMGVPAKIQNNII